jgi:hypothetical protein
MARQRKPFLEEFKETIAQASSQHGLGEPDYELEAIPGPQVLDEDGEPVEDEDGDPMSYPTVQALGATFRITLYTPVKNHPGVFKAASIPRRMRRKCLAKHIIGSGGPGVKPLRAFYEKKELDALYPGGWMRWEEAYEQFELGCFDETCPKRFDSAQKLRQHMLAVHGSDEFDVWKDEIEDLVREEQAAKRAARASRKEALS